MHKRLHSAKRVADYSNLFVSCNAKYHSVSANLGDDCHKENYMTLGPPDSWDPV